VIKYITPWRIVIALTFMVAAVLVVLRFAFGLGEITNLSDATPWGMWVGFDIMAGVGLAGGGFVMAGIVYIFNIEKYRPLVRSAILTAMLGYILFVIGLIVEVGRPWNMWRCLTDHNFHSPLFEVAWCVMLYTTVLILEFSGVIFEKLGWHKLVHLHHKISVVLVAFGILLSTLHQSTLGTLLTIMPYRMHELWYSPILPLHFFISCIAAGMAMVTVESFLSERYRKHPARVDLLSSLMRIMSIFLILFFVVRFEDLLVQLGISGTIAAVSTGFAAVLFWLETLCFTVIPCILIWRHGNTGIIPRRPLFAAGFITVIGFIMHRFNVTVSAMELKNPTGYFPSVSEFVFTFALILAGFVAAGLAIHYLPMSPPEKEEEARAEGMMRVDW
jgi:Ni/Fe-hydrogenase subunit HybB-like protein